MWKSKVIRGFLTVLWVWTPHSCVAQGSTIKVILHWEKKQRQPHSILKIEENFFYLFIFIKSSKGKLLGSPEQFHNVNWDQGSSCFTSQSSLLNMCLSRPGHKWDDSHEALNWYFRKTKNERLTPADTTCDLSQNPEKQLTNCNNSLLRVHS